MDYFLICIIFDLLKENRYYLIRTVPINYYYWDFLTFCYNLVKVKKGLSEDIGNLGVKIDNLTNRVVRTEEKVERIIKEKV